MRIQDEWRERARGTHLMSEFSLTVFCGSFEERCFALPSMMAPSLGEATVLLTREPDSIHGFQFMAEGKLIELCRQDSRTPRVERVRLQDPHQTWSILSSILSPYSDDGPILIDITTMPRELIGMIIAVLGTHAIVSGRVSFGYVPAMAYDEDHPWQELWLSRGIKDIRAVLGYEGISSPGGTHLIMINGFELERAKAIIERLEPASISLAHTTESGSTHPKFAQVQEAVARELERYLAIGSDKVAIFPKSCSKTYESLENHIQILVQRGLRNVCIAPLNTKPSSLAAFLVAREHPEIQVIYAEPQVYNTDHYSIGQDGFFEIAVS